MPTAKRSYIGTKLFLEKRERIGFTTSTNAPMVTADREQRHPQPTSHPQHDHQLSHQTPPRSPHAPLPRRRIAKPQRLNKMKNTMKPHIAQLLKLGACEEGVAFAQTQPDMAATWSNCPRGDWLLWLIAKKTTEADRNNLVLAACSCARHSLPIDDKRMQGCIEMTEAWTRGKATIEQVRLAHHAAYASASSSSSAAYAYAAYAYAAHAYTAYTAYTAFAYAATVHSGECTQAQTADIVRKYFPNPPKL